VRQYRYSANCDEIVVVLSDYKTEVGTAVSMKAVLANALNDIEELKARVPERPEPAEAPREDRDAGELLSCKEQLACVNRQLLDYEEQITECRTRIGYHRDAMECCWTVLENAGFVRTDGETLPQALSRFIGVKNEELVSLRAKLQAIENALKALGT
jgi:chromosome segregation ATPase